MSELSVGTWKDFIDQNTIDPLVELEQACWAPWLAASGESLAARAEIFPEGQRCVYSKLGLLATLSVNKIQWDGQPGSLQSWDQLAGKPPTFEQTYVAYGNTLCLMSMNVSESGRGRKLPQLLIKTLLDFAKSSDIEHVIGSFRPTEYSQTVLEAISQGHEPPTLEAYCQTTNVDGEPIDRWMRALSRNGVGLLAVDSSAMRVPVTQQEFAELKQPNWQQINMAGQLVWWCDQTGFFYPQPNGSYLYVEGNQRGRLC